MSKKTYNLPNSSAENAEQRLEELVEHKVITRYEYCSTDRGWIKDGECKFYPDGFEAILEDNGHFFGYLRIERRNLYLCYDIKKEYELQNLQDEVEK